MATAAYVIDSSLTGPQLQQTNGALSTINAPALNTFDAVRAKFVNCKSLMRFEIMFTKMAFEALAQSSENR